MVLTSTAKNILITLTGDNKKLSKSLVDSASKIDKFSKEAKSDLASIGTEITTDLSASFDVMDKSASGAFSNVSKSSLGLLPNLAMLTVVGDKVVGVTKNLVSGLHTYLLNLSRGNGVVGKFADSLSNLSKGALMLLMRKRSLGVTLEIIRNSLRNTSRTSLTAATSLGVLRGAVVALQVAIVALVAVVLILVAGFALLSVKFVKMAAEEDEVTRRTKSLLETIGVSWEEAGDGVNSYLNSLEELTGYNDTDLQNSFNAMIGYGMNVEEALAGVGYAADFAYLRGIDLATSEKLVARAYEGDYEALSRYLPKLKDLKTDTEKAAYISEYFESIQGKSSDRTKTLAGQTNILKNRIADAAEELGNRMLPSTIKLMEALNWGVEKVLPSLIKYIVTFGLTIKWVISIIKLWTLVLFAPYEIIKSLIEGDFTEGTVERLNAIANQVEEIKVITYETLNYSYSIADTEERKLLAFKAQNSELTTQIDLQEQLNDMRSKAMTAAESGISASEFSGGDFGTWSDLMSFTPGTDTTNLDRAKQLSYLDSGAP